MVATLKSDMDNINKKYKGIISSIAFHLCLLALFLTPLLQLEQKPIPKEEGGLTVVFGDPDAGMEETVPIAESKALSTPSEAENTNEIADINAKTTVISKPNPSPKPTITPKPVPKATTSTNKTTTLPTNEINNQNEAQEKKNKFADAIKKSGSNNKPGQQGQTTGDPNGGALSGITKGSGQVGGGLVGRGVTHAPTFSDKSQKTGKIALNVCVDSNGNVKSAEFTQKGSSSTDSYLIDLAKKTSLKYKFSPSEITRQCGTIIIDFKVQ